MKLANVFLAAATVLVFSAFNQVYAQKSLIGIVEKPPEGFGCYFVMPADINKTSDKRRYLFIGEDDGSGLMNIGGSDLKLTRGKSSQNGKNKSVLTYSTGKVKVTLNLTQTKTTNDGADTHFDALIKAVKGAQTQSIRAKGFCGG